MPFGTPGTMLQPTPATYGQRQGTPLDKVPAAHMVALGHLGFQYLAQGYFSSVVKVSW